MTTPRCPHPLLVRLFAVCVSCAPAPALAIIGGEPPDSPAARVDATTTTSAYAGVGSLQVMQPGTSTVAGTFTATAVSPFYVLTAAHTVAGKDPADIRFHLNFGADLSHTIRASAVFVHPTFNQPPGNLLRDDLALVRLASPLPAGVPIYALHGAPVNVGTVVTLVGYGRGGDGVNGATTGGSATVKRTGANRVEELLDDQGGSGLKEVYVFDFDGPTAATNRYGLPLPGNLTLGNSLEAQLASGDSGSPALVPGPNGTWAIAGVNTFVAALAGERADRFGAFGGGMLIHPYRNWIEETLASPVPEPAQWLSMLAGLGLLAGLHVRRTRGRAVR